MIKEEKHYKSSIPDFSSLSNEELYKLDIYHEIDTDFCLSQLNGLYGKINSAQDKELIESVFGKNVLDVGSGLGTLSYRLKINNFNVTSIEPNEDSSKIAKENFGIDSFPHSIYNTPFEDNSFDTVILRECVEHLDFELALAEIKRICSKRVIIFQTNLNPLVKILRKRGGHDEYNPQDLNYYRNTLKKYGFSEQITTYRDPMAFPLSGGYHCSQLVPSSELLENGVLKTDNLMNSLLRKTKLSKHFCWRYLLISDKK